VVETDDVTELVTLVDMLLVAVEEIEDVTDVDCDVVADDV
jgi:hypothetical protein